MTENSVVGEERAQTATALTKFACRLRALFRAGASSGRAVRRDVDRLSDHMQRDIGLSRERS
jgi:hypothetical protein